MWSMGQKTIHPTTHAIERFEQRVLPHLPEDSRTRLRKKEKIRQDRMHSHAELNSLKNRLSSSMYLPSSL